MLRHFEAYEVLRIAVQAEVDPRTVARFLAGKAVRPLVRARIERAVQLYVGPGGAPSKAER